MGRRVLAFVIDWAIVFVLAVIAVVALAEHVTDVPTSFCDGRVIESDEICLQTNDEAFVATGGDAKVIVALPLLTWVVNGVFIEALAGGTIGKLILGLRVVRADGNHAGFGRVLGRFAMFLIATALCAFFFLGYIVELIVSGVTKPHRTVGDRTAGTFVVGKADVGRRPQGPSPWAQPGPVTMQTPWGAPPGSPGWGQPPHQGTPGWGPPPGQGAPGWGQPPGWGTPTPTPTPTPSPGTGAPHVPTGQPAGPPLADQPDPAGWAAPTAGAASPSPSGASPTPVASTPSTWGPSTPEGTPTTTPASTHPAPQWDLQLKAWTIWDPPRGQWLQWDDAKQEWRPMGR
jgi:uncharacterized RDD family membrane protein YckC